MLHNYLFTVIKYGVPKTHPSIHSRIIPVLLLAIFLLSSVIRSNAQSTSNDTLPSLTLQQCIDYAMSHQPAYRQSLVKVSIAKTTNAINQSGWWPQANVSGNFTHYIQLPTTFSNATGTPLPQNFGVINTAVPGLAVTQSLFSPSLLYASKSAPLYIKQAQQATDSSKIELVTAVSKSFYNLLLTLQQVNVLKEDTLRLSQSQTDAYHQYVGGIVDETDYQQAAITLNNSKAQLRQAIENIVPQYATLKQFMGYPPENHFNISYDTAQMNTDIEIDTAEQLQYEKRIEYRQLATTQGLQRQLVDYYKLAALPTVSAFYNYNYEYQNSDFPKLFSIAYPYSLVGLTVSLPVFNGFNRVNNLKRAKLQENLLDWTNVNLKSQIYTEYTSALASYKSNRYNWQVLQDNVTMAKRVYFVVTLQYNQGIVPYLNVITAESNLITSEIGYLNALFQLMSSKIDLEKAMGNIPY